MALAFYDQLDFVLSLGATRSYIAEQFKVDRRTVYNWENKRCWPTFRSFCLMRAWVEEIRRAQATTEKATES